MVWKNCGLCGWGFETNPGLRSCFLLPGGDKGVSLKVLFCSYFGCPVQEHLCIWQVAWIFLEVSLENCAGGDSRQILVCGRFFVLPGGDTGVSLKGLFC